MVRLRPAEPADEGRLLEWRNEPTTRAASLTSGEVSAEDHSRWLAHKLADPASTLFIVMDGDEPIGQVRLDRVDDELAEVSIGLAPEARGRGAGRKALDLAAAEAPRLGVMSLRALIKPNNEASLRAFKAAGYADFKADDEVVELRRPVPEQAIDWAEEWRRTEVDPEAPAEEARTQRWKGQERIILSHFGSFEGLRVIEIGAGRATNAVLYAERGAKTTVLDVSSLALDQAMELFGAHGVEPETVEADIFDLPEELLGGFDVAMSFGLCEHFLGERRARSIAVHLELVRPGGLALVSVPNSWSPIYRAWMAVEKRRGTWRLGTEEPFTVAELRRLAEQAGGEPLEPVHGSLVASVVGQGLNGVLGKLGRNALRVPNQRIPVADRLAYELLLPVLRPSSTR